MKNRVNPPELLRVPPTERKELDQFLRDQLYNIFQLWKRTGGSSDFIDENTTGLYEFDDILKQESVEDKTNQELVTTAVDYTTTGNQIVICTAALTVFLNPEPEDQEMATVHITNGNVNVNAGTKKVNEQDFITVDFSAIQGLATLDCKYFIDIDKWVIV